MEKVTEFMTLASFAGMVLRWSVRNLNIFVLFHLLKSQKRYAQ